MKYILSAYAVVLVLVAVVTVIQVVVVVVVVVSLLINTVIPSGGAIKLYVLYHHLPVPVVHNSAIVRTTLNVQCLRVFLFLHNCPFFVVAVVLSPCMRKIMIHFYIDFWVQFSPQQAGESVNHSADRVHNYSA